MRGEGVTDHGNLVWSSVEEPAAKVIDLRRVHGQEGEAGMELLPRVQPWPALLLPQQRVGPPSIPGHLGDDTGELRGLRIEDPLH